MVSSYSPQTTLKGQPFRAFEQRWPADNRTQTRLLQERPSAAKASRKMLRHWRNKTSTTPLVRRAA
jgi:hypothetical protein